MPTLPVSAISAQTPVTAMQYNDMISSVQVIPTPGWADWTATGMASGQYILWQGTPASSPNNRWTYMFMRPRYVGGFNPETSLRNTSAYIVMGMIRNEACITTGKVSGTWETSPTATWKLGDGATGNQGPDKVLGRTTATIIGSTYIQWDLASVITATLYSQFEVASLGGGATASGVLRVSTDGAAFTNISAHTANGAGEQGTAWVSAGVVLRYVQLSLHNFGAAGGTASITAYEIGIYTASAWDSGVSGDTFVTMVSATHSGGIFMMIQSAATYISAEYASAWPAWRR